MHIASFAFPPLSKLEQHTREQEANLPMTYRNRERLPVIRGQWRWNIDPVKPGKSSAIAYRYILSMAKKWPSAKSGSGGN
jgi:hypothetical protein